MNDLLNGLALGLQVATTPANLLYCFVGALSGTIIGVLPGLGPLATIAMLLPVVVNLPPESAIIMLAGVYYGAQYGGSTTSILLNVPGEASSIITALDGHAMAKRGEAARALAIAAIASVIAGFIATFVVAVLAPPLADLALVFRSQDYFALMMLGLVASVVLVRGSVINAIAMVVLGVLLSTVGTDLNSGVQRFHFGFPELGDGISFVAIAMGLFGLVDVIRELEKPEGREMMMAKLGRVRPKLSDILHSMPSILRGTGLGSILGVLPGGGAVLASFGSYAIERNIARAPRRFGQGDIRGVAGPEAANNAAAQTSFIPLLTLGLPSGPVMALLLGALMMQGIIPGPQLVASGGQLFWGLVISMLVGNIMLVVLNLPLVGVWASLLMIPYRILFPAIVFFCCIGAYAASNSVFEIATIVVFTLLGYVLKKLDCEPAPLVLGFILGQLIEQHFRRSMLISSGDLGALVERPLSLGFLSVAALLVVFVSIPKLRSAKNKAIIEEF